MESENTLNKCMCDSFLLKVMAEYYNENNFNKDIDDIINDNIIKYKVKLNTIDNITDIYRSASVDKQIDFIKLIFSLKYNNSEFNDDDLSDIWIHNDETVERLLNFGIESNMYDLCDYVLYYKIGDIIESKYIEFEKKIKDTKLLTLFNIFRISEKYNLPNLNEKKYKGLDD